VIFVHKSTLIYKMQPESTISPASRAKILSDLYETVFPSVALFVRQKNGSLEDARDIFQDSLIIYYEKTYIHRTISMSDEAGYLLGIAKHLWFKKFGEGIKEQNIDLSFYKETNIDEEPKVSESILQFVERSGKKCLELLKSFYYDQMSMKEIGKKFGFSSERSATVQKFKCLEKIRHTVKERSLIKEDFYE
jgi:DNA-directed RNA polymerase specialized sigma24 family protein